MSQLLAILTLFVAAQGYLLVMLIMYAPGQKPLSRRLLAIYVFIQASSIFRHYFVYSGIILPEYTVYVSHLSFAFGPLIYFYTQSLISPEFRFKWHHVLHFTPVLVSILFDRLYFSAILSLEEPPYPKSPVSLTVILYEIVDYLWMITYLLLAVRLLPEYERFIRGNFSSLESITLGWLYRLITLFLGVYAVLTIGKLLYVLGFAINLNINRVLESISKIIFFYFIAISGYRQQSAFYTDKSAAKEKHHLERPIPAKYQHSSLSREACETLWQKLNNYMREQQPFLDENLKLQSLAKGVGISANQLSQSVNSISGQSFYDFVNGYRVEKARELIEQPGNEHLTMLDVAMESGFANNATFHRHFKKRFATTPLQYKKSITGKSDAKRNNQSENDSIST